MLDPAESAADSIADDTTKLQQHLHRKRAPTCLTEDELILENVCLKCDHLAGDLAARLKKLSLSKNRKRRGWKSFKVALLSLWTKEEIATIKERLAEYRRDIDSRVLWSLSQQVDLIAAQQSERFDLLDNDHKVIFRALIDSVTSERRSLQTQISALSLLLDRAEVVIASHELESSTTRVVKRVFRETLLDEEEGSESKGNFLIERIRREDLTTRDAINVQLLESLFFFTKADRYEAVHEAHDKTFRWIFRPPEDTIQYSEGRSWNDFGKWLHFGNGIYWINGKAGSGKSTLMKYILNHPDTKWYLSQWAGESKLCFDAFFFWNSGTIQQRSQSGLLRSLLYDILKKCPKLIPVVLPLQWAARYSETCIPSMKAPSEPWLLSTLQLAFKILVTQTLVPLKLCLFIDGLDEYEGSDIEIADILGNASISKNVKICCSSRPHQVFKDAFVTRPGLRLQDLTFPDVRQYIHDKLELNTRMQQLTRDEPLATKDLISEIEVSASGVFLWVSLVVTSLLSGLGQHDDIDYLQKRLRLLPEELDNLYDHMVFKVDKVYQEERSKLFQLVDCSSREQHTLENAIEDRETSPLSILLLSFASEKDSELCLTAPVGFLGEKDVLNRCKKMEVVLRTRCGGLLEVQYGTLDRSEAIISPTMKVGYLHRTVKDFLEMRETRTSLSDRTKGSTRYGFQPVQEIFKAHILALKALDGLNTTEHPPWALIEETLTWACHAEAELKDRDFAIRTLDYIDEFFEVISQTWQAPHSSRNSFFEEQKSMLSLAAQCGMYRYLEAKLSQANVIEREGAVERSLFDFALVPDENSGWVPSIGVINTLLNIGANPNLRGHNKQSPWENALCYLNVIVEGIEPGETKLKIVRRWAEIIKLLLEAGADPTATCQKPTRYINFRSRRIASDQPWSIYEVISRVYASEYSLKYELQRVLEQTCNRLESFEKRERPRRSQTQTSIRPKRLSTKKSCRQQ